mmetsp:Transcript_46336/g.75921  ORF Transcript_46336/g.75921 Transcript_46336/m.75921 type:complete len:223 (+) Transcript_46336:327-995(+)
MAAQAMAAHSKRGDTGALPAGRARHRCGWQGGTGRAGAMELRPPNLRNTLPPHRRPGAGLGARSPARRARAVCWRCSTVCNGAFRVPHPLKVVWGGGRNHCRAPVALGVACKRKVVHSLPATREARRAQELRMRRSASIVGTSSEHDFGAHPLFPSEHSAAGPRQPSWRVAYSPRSPLPCAIQRFGVRRCACHGFAAQRTRARAHTRARTRASLQAHTCRHT